MNAEKARKLTEQMEELKIKKEMELDENMWRRARKEAESIFKKVVKTIPKQIEKAAKHAQNSTSIWDSTEDDEYTGRVNYLVSEMLSEHLKEEGYKVKVSVDQDFKCSDDSREEPLTNVVASW